VLFDFFFYLDRGWIEKANGDKGERAGSCNMQEEKNCRLMQHQVTRMMIMTALQFRKADDSVHLNELSDHLHEYLM